MESNNEMKRMAIFIVIFLLTMMVWNYFNPQPQQPEQAAAQTEQQAAAPVAGNDLPPTKPITVSTDTLKAVTPPVMPAKPLPCSPTTTSTNTWCNRC